MRSSINSWSFRTALVLAAALSNVGCASRVARDSLARSASDERAVQIPSLFSLLERADGQRCRGMRDGRYACCATLVDRREACWPRADEAIPWRSQPTINDEQAAANAPTVSLAPSVSCATTVDGQRGCCARGGDGTLRCWTDRHAPAVDDPANGLTAHTIAGLPGVVRRITAGARRTCALVDDGSVWCWGVNYDGRPVPRLGQPLSWRRRAWSPVPVRVVGLPRAVSIADGGSVDLGGSLCVIATDATVWCVDASVWTHHGMPRGRVEQIEGVRGATALALGAMHGCALTAEGAVSCWGENDFGQLGRGTFVAGGDRHAARVDLPPTQQISAGWNTTCARLRDATVRCWGGNFFGVVGDGSNQHRNRPVAVAGLASVAEIAVTHEHACARSDDGSLACWGSNSSASPRAPVPVGRVSDSVQLALGSFVSCALRRDGGASCWGGLDWGNGVVRWNDPTELRGISRATQLVVGTPGGVGPTRLRVCAITADGAAQCIGKANTVGDE